MITLTLAVPDDAPPETIDLVKYAVARLDQIVFHACQGTLRKLSEAELSERAEGLRCGRLLTQRALDAVSGLMAPGNDNTLERNARAAVNGWAAVSAADGTPRDPNRHDEPREKEEPIDPMARRLYGMIGERSLVFKTLEMKHKPTNERVLANGVLREFGAAFPAFAPTTKRHRERALPLVIEALSTHGRKGRRDAIAQLLMLFCADMTLDKAMEHAKNVTKVQKKTDQGANNPMTPRRDTAGERTRAARKMPKVKGS